MFKRFKDWIVHKCGGYTETDKEKIVEEAKIAPREVKHKVFQVQANTVKLSTVIPFTVYDEELLGIPLEDKYKIIQDATREQLIREIGEAIVEKGLYAEEYQPIYDVDRCFNKVAMKYTISVNDIHEASIMPWSDDATKSYYSSKHGISARAPLNPMNPNRYPWGKASDDAAWKSFGDEWLRREKESDAQCCCTPESQKIFGGDISSIWTLANGDTNET